MMRVARWCDIYTHIKMKYVLYGGNMLIWKRISNANFDLDKFLSPW